MSQVSIIDIENNHPQIPTQFDGNVGSAVPIGNLLNILGAVVTAGSNPFRTVASGNTVTAQVQISQAIASTNAASIGLSAFNSTDFTVDANGFVALKTISSPLTFPTDSGTGTPASNVLNVRGQLNYAGAGGVEVTSLVQPNTLDIRLFSPYTLGNYSFENNTASTSRLLAVQNNDNNAASNAIFRAGVVGTSAADPYLQVGVNAVWNYCWGIDNSDAQKLKICGDSNSNSAAPSGGTLFWYMDKHGNQKFYDGISYAYLTGSGGVINTNTYYFSVTTNTAVSATLPDTTSAFPPEIGQTYVIKDQTGLAATNPITVNALGGALLDGSSSFSINLNFGSATFIWNGTGYEVYAAYRQGNHFYPGNRVHFYNDFLDRHDYLSTDGTGGSSNIGYGTTVANPGQVWLQVSGGSASAAIQTQSFFIPGGGSVIYDNSVQIATLGSATNRISVQAGLLDQFGGLQNGNPNNGIYFQYEDDINTGHWQCITKSAGTATTTSTSVAATTSFTSLKIQINAAGTSIGFFINDVLVATNTTNIPTVPLAIDMSLGIGASSGATMQVAWDYYDFDQILTVNRR